MKRKLYLINPILLLKQSVSVYSIFPIFSNKSFYSYSKKFIGKKICVYGDSIVKMNMWQPFVFNVIPIKNYNKGLGGTRMSQDTGKGYKANMANQARLASLPITDIYLINGGMNDWRNNLPIGTIDDTIPGTLYGGMYTIMNYILNEKNSKAFIIFNTVTYGLLANECDVNEGGLSVQFYNQAIKNFCIKYNLQFIDIYQCVEWTKLNIDNFVQTDANGEKIHPNKFGGFKMADAIINILFKINFILLFIFSEIENIMIFFA